MNGFPGFSNPSKKGAIFKRKNLVLEGVSLYVMGDKHILGLINPLESVSIPSNKSIENC